MAGLFEVPDPQTAGETVGLDILVDGGPLVIAGVWDWSRGRRNPGLYKIYIRRFGASVGPFYAGLQLAERGMKKALGLQPGLWVGQPAEWYLRQTWLHQWVNRELGKAEDLVGGQWVSDENWPPVVGRPATR